MLTITYCEPFNGRLALSAVVAAWLLPRLLTSPLWDKSITEQDLHDFIVETEPRYNDLFSLANLPTYHETRDEYLDDHDDPDDDSGYCEHGVLFCDPCEDCEDILDNHRAPDRAAKV